MNKNEYVIINRTKLLKEIEELQKTNSKDFQLYFECGKIAALKEILFNSIELISEIEKAFDEGKEAYLESTFSNSAYFYNEIKEDYINQLKLDI